jgi:hypothetical protein
MNNINNQNEDDNNNHHNQNIFLDDHSLVEVYAWRDSIAEQMWEDYLNHRATLGI